MAAFWYVLCHSMWSYTQNTPLMHFVRVGTQPPQGNGIITYDFDILNQNTLSQTTQSNGLVHLSTHRTEGVWRNQATSLFGPDSEPRVISSSALAIVSRFETQDYTFCTVWLNNETQKPVREKSNFFPDEQRD